MYDGVFFDVYLFSVGFSKYFKHSQVSFEKPIKQNSQTHECVYGVLVRTLPVPSLVFDAHNDRFSTNQHTA